MNELGVSVEARFLRREVSLSDLREQYLHAADTSGRRVLRALGQGYDLIHHAMHSLGSRNYGFVQEMDDTSGDDNLAPMAALLPNLIEMLMDVRHDDPENTLGWCDDQTKFEFGLDLLLDGLERVAAN